MEWISIYDGLPKDYEMVFVLSNGNPTTGYFVVSQNTMFWWNTDTDVLKNVTHWMPSPDPI
jgi:hypothetical protein